MRGALSAAASDSEDIYWPCINGVATYYGGYGLSGDSMKDLARHGEAAALGLTETGAKGERFFSELEALIGVSKQNFHGTILRLIGAHD